MNGKYIGLQIKSVSGLALDHYQWERMHEKEHAKFTEEHVGKVFFVYSKKVGKKARIENVGVVEEIAMEIETLHKGADAS